MPEIDIANLDFGSIDARFEFLNRNPRKRDLFQAAFFLPPSIDEDQLLSGERFLVVGPKGAGKTAVLRHLERKLKRDFGSRTRFVVFRDDITAEEKENLIRLGGVSLYEDEADEDGGETEEALLPWMLFVHREVVRLLRENPGSFAETTPIANYMSLVEGAFGRQDNQFKKMISRMTGAKFKVTAASVSAEAHVTLDPAKGDATVPIGEFIRVLNSLLSVLHVDEAHKPGIRFDIFFDELNLNFISKKQHRRDTIVLRDLISACGSFNAFCAEKELPIFVYTALRTEIVKGIDAQSRELSKLIADGGCSISWYDANVSPSEQPIIDLVRRRIFANEVAYGRDGVLRGIWDRYFDTKIYNSYSMPFILYNTWARPRDVVRIFSDWKKEVRKSQKFGTKSFDRVALSYSRSCWDEKRDELNTTYANAEIDCIEKVFLSFKRVFTFGEFETRVIYLQQQDARTKQFFSGRNSRKLLEDLFTVGVLGNAVLRSSKEEFDFIYHGRTELNIAEKMCLHRSLWLKFEVATSFRQREELHAPFKERKRR